MFVLVYEWTVCMCLVVFGAVCVKQWGRTDILAQASSSRLGENCRSSPRFYSTISLRRRVLVPSDASSCSGENGSPKRTLEKNLVFSAWVLVQARDFWFKRRVVSLRREGLAKARARRVPLLTCSLRRNSLA